MNRMFLATWIKLRRRALLWGTYGAAALVSALITSVVFLTAGDASSAAAPGPQGPGQGVTGAALEASDGLLQGLSSGVTVFGVIALCVAVATFAGEYTSGTLRNLLIRAPNRLRLLTGTWAAVVSFTLGAVLLSAVVAGAFAVTLAGSQQIATGAWFTAAGLADSARTLGQVALAAVGYATLGSAIGVLVRTSVPAIAFSVAWLLPIEGILSASVDGSDRWLPGQLLAAVASNGTATITLTAALVTVTGYLLVAMGAAGTSFVRRDVTA
jgi:ABC-2 type transport system permease protein